MSFTAHTGPPYETPVTPKPKGTTRKTDTKTSGAAPGNYVTIVSHTPADGVTFSLAKILVTWSGTDEQHIRVKLGDEVIGEYYATAYVMDWFPAGTELVGNVTGTKAVVIEARAATPADLTGFIVGEES